MGQACTWAPSGNCWMETNTRSRMESSAMSPPILKVPPVGNWWKDLLAWGKEPTKCASVLHKEPQILHFRVPLICDSSKLRLKQTEIGSEPFKIKGTKLLRLSDCRTHPASWAFAPGASTAWCISSLILQSSLRKPYPCGTADVPESVILSSVSPPPYAFAPWETLSSFCLVLGAEFLPIPNLCFGQ